jgi:hypothetical protein
MKIFEEIVLAIDAMFFIDILVILRTTYIDNSTGDEIWSPSMIAKNYIFSYKFWIDLISSLPLDYFKVGSGIV